MAPVARVATVQLMTPNNGSDGATMRIGMKAADGSSGLAHTVDVRAAPTNALRATNKKKQWGAWGL